MQQKIMDYLIDTWKKQGIGFVLMSIMGWYFYTQVNEIKHEFVNCNEALLKVYSDLTIQNQAVIIRNTEALNKIEIIIDKEK